MNKEEVEQYIRKDLGCEPRHCCESLASASKHTAMEIESTPWDVLQLVLENKPISDFYTHSYGFHTRQGREIIKLFESNYNSYATSNNTEY
jgi:hypothetical protein